MDILFLFILNGILAGFLLRFAYKSIIGYIFSLSLMIVFSYAVWMILPYLLLFSGLLGGHGSGGHGWTISWNKIFLVVSAIHLLFFLIVFLFQKEKKHWIKLFISLCITLYAYQSIYVDRYIEMRKDKNIVHSSSYSNNHTRDGNETKVIVDTILKKSSYPKCPIPSKNILSVLKDKYSDCNAFNTWQKPDISSLKIHQEQFDMLRKYVMQKPNINYTYKIQIVANKAIFIVTSSDRPKMRLLFYLSKTDVWHVDRIITRTSYNKKLVHMHGDVSDIHMKTIAANPELVNYYKQEFDSAMKNFILAKNAYEVFKTRVQYGFALKYMETYGEWYEYLNYREKRMDEIAQELNMTESLEENKKRLENIYNGSSFQIMNNIQDEMLANLNIGEDKYISTIDLYKIFRKKYLKEMLKDNQFDSNLLQKQFLEYEPLYLPALKRKYMYQRLMQKKEKQSWKEFIATKIIKLLDTKTSINQKIDFKTTGAHMVVFPIIAATETCNYGLTKRLLEHGTKLDTYTLGESVLFNTINVCDNIDIVRLLVKYGANINETTSVGSFNHRPYFTFLVQKICTKNSQEIIALLKELYEEGTISHDRYYNDKIIQNKLSHCNHDWNSGGGIMGLRRGFIYTNNYISKEKLKELFDNDSTILKLIDSLENIKIRDIHYNLKKYEAYEMKYLKVRR